MPEKLNMSFWILYLHDFNITQIYKSYLESNLHLF